MACATALLTRTGHNLISYLCPCAPTERPRGSEGPKQRPAESGCGFRGARTSSSTQREPVCEEVLPVGGRDVTQQAREVHDPPTDAVTSPFRLDAGGMGSGA